MCSFNPCLLCDDSVSHLGFSCVIFYLQDETSVCKNLLQETAQRAGVSLPVYTTIRGGAGHLPVFKCIVEVAGRVFVGDPAKSKKQAEKNAAMSAWSAIKKRMSLFFLPLSLSLGYLFLSFKSMLGHVLHENLGMLTLLRLIEFNTMVRHVQQLCDRTWLNTSRP